MTTEHFCEFTVVWPEHQDEHAVKCGVPATIKHGYQGIFGWKTMWVCADHYDEIQKNTAEYEQAKKDAAITSPYPTVAGCDFGLNQDPVFVVVYKQLDKSSDFPLQ